MKKSFIIIILLLCFSCSSRQTKLERQISELIVKQGNNFELKLDTISSFKWDELLVAGPYSNLNKIKDYNLDKFPSNATSYDQFVFFGFLHKKKAIKWISINRNSFLDSLYTSKDNYKVYPKNSTYFKLKE